MAEEFFDLGEVNMAEVESGGLIPEGWYRVKVANVEEDINTNAVAFEFEIVAGPHKGCVVKDTLWHPANAKDATAERFTKNRRVLFARRLGLISEADVQQKKRVSVKWTATLHREVFVKVTHRNYEKKDKQGKLTGEKGTAANLTFGDIYPVDDARVPEEVRKAQGGGSGSDSGSAGAGVPANGPTNGSGSAGNTPAGQQTADQRREYAKQFGL